MSFPEAKVRSDRPPEPAAGFTWQPASWGWQLNAAVLPGIVHGWSTRPLSPGEQDDEGWRAVAAELAIPVAHLHRLRQVHGAVVHEAAGVRGPVRPRADIVVAGRAGTGVAVQVADCVPLLLADRRTGAVAAAHAGWRGTAADVAGEAVRALGRRFGADAGDIVAAIGPSIGPCCYEIGAELVDRFVEAGWKADVGRWVSERGGQRLFDLWTANRDQLVRAGVPPAAVAVSGLCTACHPAWFYSYRRDGPGTGRIAGYVRGMGGWGDGGWGDEEASGRGRRPGTSVARCPATVHAHS